MIADVLDRFLLPDQQADAAAQLIMRTAVEGLGYSMRQLEFDAQEIWRKPSTGELVRLEKQRLVAKLQEMVPESVTAPYDK